MSAFLGSSVLVAALAPDESNHAGCLTLLLKGGHWIYSHALLETFSILTGGKLGVRVSPDLASQMLSETILPRVSVIELSSTDIIDALRVAQSRGGAWRLHLGLHAPRGGEKRRRHGDLHPEHGRLPASASR